MEISLRSSAPVVTGRLGRVVTDRLELQPIDEKSVTALAPVFAKPEVWKYPYGRAFGAAETEEFVASQTEHWNVLGFGLWLVIDRHSSRTLGYVGLAVPTFLPQVLPAVEVGWRLDPDVWGNGYATEAGAAALDGAFGALGLPQVISLPQVDNPASVRVAERLGMHASHTILAPETQSRGPVEIVVMELTSDQWLSRNPGT